MTSADFQFLQADRIVPRTLYPQATQQARDTGFLGSRGEYAVDFLGLAAKRPVSRVRTFPRTGLGITEELLIRYHIALNVQRGLDVTVAHELLLHRDCSPSSVGRATMGLFMAVGSRPTV